MEKQTTITAPKGHYIDLENSKIVYKPIERVIPKTWEELGKIDGYFIDTISQICLCMDVSTNHSSYKNTFPSRELAEASLALAQLIQLRDRYNGDNKGFINNAYNYCIYVYDSNIIKTVYNNTQELLSFRTEELRDKFYDNFKDLMEIAKPLL